MSWLPSFCIIGTCCCEPEGEYEGKTLQLKWRGWVFEITIARWEATDAAR